MLVLPPKRRKDSLRNRLQVHTVPATPTRRRLVGGYRVESVSDVLLPSWASVGHVASTLAERVGVVGDVRGTRSRAGCTRWPQGADHCLFESTRFGSSDDL